MCVVGHVHVNLKGHRPIVEMDKHSSSKSSSHPNLSVSVLLNEVMEIKREIHTLSMKTKGLKKLLKEREATISSILERAEKPGVKHKDLYVIRRETQQRKRKSNKAKREDMLEVLQAHGIPDPEKIIEELETARNVTKECVKLDYQTAESLKREAKRKARNSNNKNKRGGSVNRGGSMAMGRSKGKPKPIGKDNDIYYW